MNALAPRITTRTTTFKKRSLKLCVSPTMSSGNLVRARIPDEKLCQDLNRCRSFLSPAQLVHTAFLSASGAGPPQNRGDSLAHRVQSPHPFEYNALALHLVTRATNPLVVPRCLPIRSARSHPWPCQPDRRQLHKQ